MPDWCDSCSFFGADLVGTLPVHIHRDGCCRRRSMPTPLNNNRPASHCMEEHVSDADGGIGQVGLDCVGKGSTYKAYW